jgi:CHAT domain-containing protein
VPHVSISNTDLAHYQASQQFFRRGASSVFRFLGPVTDEAGKWIAVKFYDELRNGATLGEALHSAKLYQRSRMPEDWSWVSIVLFGDPTSTLTGNISV